MKEALISLWPLAVFALPALGGALPSSYGIDRSVADSLYGRSPDGLTDTGIWGSRLDKRQDNGPIQCSSSTPCADGSCCNSNGKCGYAPEHCSPTSPVKCLSNCSAKAMCGKYGVSGQQRCGLNLCCSYFGWCGTTPLHCTNADPKGNTLPCQSGYGLCQVVPPPSCGRSSGTASNGRKIGYYQAANVRSRKCDIVYPQQLVTDGFTQLNLAFANIDPVTFVVGPASPADASIYRSFTALAQTKPGLQTWIAIGGFDFSDPGTPTHTTWSDLVSSASNRAAFIASLKSFLPAFGFHGVDLDWEYPTAPERGGRLSDAANYVLLVKEMRAALPGYGISLVLAPDYWYLRGMDPKAMEPYVDHFGFMSYDLHGSWDAKNPTLGAKVRPQTDIREIYNNTRPLWFGAVTPSKVNFGLAFYGRGYTLSSSSCSTLECPFTGPNDAASCTNFGGVMSNKEIQRVIKDKGLKPTLLADAQIKQITWGNQWIGYDDDETMALKVQTANDLCMGGTMVWSVDFDPRISDSATPSGTPGGIGTGSPDDPFEDPLDRFITRKGDAVVIVSTGIKLMGASQFSYQYRYYGVRANQKVDFDYVFNRGIEPLAVTPLKLGSLEDYPTTGFKSKAIFGSVCSYDGNPNGGGNTGSENNGGSLSCLKPRSTSPDSNGGGPSEVLVCERLTPAQTHIQCQGPGVRCATNYGVCYMKPINTIQERGFGEGSPWDTLWLWSQLPWRFDPTTLDINFMRRWLRPNLYRESAMLFYARRSDYVPNTGMEGYSDPARLFAASRYWNTIWEGWPSVGIDGPAAARNDFYDMIDPNGIARAIRYTPLRGGGMQDNYFRLMSQVFAEQARGTVYVMQTNPQVPVMEGIWGEVEYPTLIRGGRVNRIVAVNPSGTDWFIIWDQGVSYVNNPIRTTDPGPAPPHQKRKRQNTGIPGSGLGSTTAEKIRACLYNPWNFDCARWSFARIYSASDQYEKANGWDFFGFGSKYIIIDFQGTG